MNKFSTFAAVAALAIAAAAPAVAQDVNPDPYVSSAGPAVFGGLSVGLVAAGIAVAIIAVAAVESSDDT
ncbi:hypothetical protein [Roseovarius arcticus]|uniref:hypothetical protein n=1 Tax=Roseovarius arcticus TaxID=2547404 RepID=UPI001110D017|nr:hypothetical protein [Roseovarius arcticus]